MKEFNNGYAVVIGAYHVDALNLYIDFGYEDISAVHLGLIYYDVMGYPQDNVRLAAGYTANRNEILAALDWLAERIKQNPGATALVYVLGYGLWDATQSNYYLLPQNLSSLNAIATEGISAEIIAQKIAAINTKNLLVLLDCAHWIPETPGWTHGAFPLYTLQDANTPACLTSSSGDQISLTYESHGRSRFAFHFAEAMLGHSPHHPDDKQLMASDAMHWVQMRVNETSAGAQFPQLYTAIDDFPIGLLLGGEGIDNLDREPPPVDILQLHAAMAEPPAELVDEEPFEAVAPEPESDKSIVLPMPSPAPTPPPVTDDQPVAIAKVLDAAIPYEVPVGKTCRLYLMIRASGSQGLVARITEVPDEISAEDVTSSGDFMLDFPRNDAGELISIPVEIEIDAPDFDPPTQRERLKIAPHKDSDIVSFFLMPMDEGMLPISISVYQDNLLLREGALQTTSAPNPNPSMRWRRAMLDLEAKVINNIETFHDHSTHSSMLFTATNGATIVASGNFALGDVTVTDLPHGSSELKQKLDAALKSLTEKVNSLPETMRQTVEDLQLRITNLLTALKRTTLDQEELDYQDGRLRRVAESLPDDAKDAVNNILMLVKVMLM